MEIKKQHPRSAFRQRASKNKIHRKQHRKPFSFSCVIETCCRNPRTSTPQTSSPSSVQKNDTAFCPHSQVARVLTRPCPPCQGLSISSTGPINFILGERRRRVPRQVFL